MSKLILSAILILTFQHVYTQSLDFSLLKFDGLEFYSSRSEIEKKLGNPLKTFEPNYECGFLSSQEQGTKYFSLDYGKVKFTGNEREKYLIELVDFENNASLVLNYGEHKLSSETTLTELGQIFGEQLIEYFINNPNGGKLMLHKGADDGIRIVIKNGKLIRFEYWSPC